MTSNKIGKINIVDSRLSPVSKNIIEDLKLGTMSKKEIANKYNVNLSTIHRLAQAHNTGIKENVNIIIVDEKKNEKETTQHGGKGYKIDDDTILEMITLLENGSSVKEVSTQLSISLQSVYKYAKEFDISIQSNRNKRNIAYNTEKRYVEDVVVVDDQKEEKVEEEFDTNNICTDSLIITKNTITAGLIKDRHPLPVDKYIFDNIDSQLMFNYNKLDIIVKEFIDKYNISSNTDLVVYVTGLVSANASLIKVCSENNINLTLMHYDEDTGIYKAQTIFSSDKYSKFNSYFSDSTFIALYECNEDVIKSGNEFWKIKIVDFNSSDKNNRNIETIIFDNKEKVWREFSKLINVVMVERSRKTIYVDRCNWDEVNQEVRFFNVSQTCNFK